MTKPRRKKATTTLPSPLPEVRFTVEQTPDEVRAILWKIASDSEQSGTARVSACRMLLMDARERDDGVEDPPRCRSQQAGIGPDAQGGELTDEMPIAYDLQGRRHSCRSARQRVALVKREIDKIGKISDLEQLFEIAGDCSWPPRRAFTPVRGALPGFSAPPSAASRGPISTPSVSRPARPASPSIRWAHPSRYCSLLDAHHERAVQREQPLDDAE